MKTNLSRVRPMVVAFATVTAFPVTVSGAPPAVTTRLEPAKAARSTHKGLVK